MPSLGYATSAPQPNDSHCLIDSQMIQDSRLATDGGSILVSDRGPNQDSRLADTILITDRISGSLSGSVVPDGMLLGDDIRQMEENADGLELNDGNTDGEISIDSDLLTLKPLRCLNNE